MEKTRQNHPLEGRTCKRAKGEANWKESSGTNAAEIIRAPLWADGLTDVDVAAETAVATAAEMDVPASTFAIST